MTDSSKRIYSVDTDWYAELDIIPHHDSAPSWRLGKYVHPSKPRAVLRQTEEGRKILLESLRLFGDGMSHERTSDIAPFVFWDGEGITYKEGRPQQYVLFGSSLGHEVRDRSLRTVDCLDLIVQAEIDQPNGIHVAFAFKYDAEMILCDLPVRSWWVLVRKGMVNYEGYRITYHPGRMFRVSTTRDGQRYTATIYDTFGFFQQSFVKALRTWLDEEELDEIEKIERGKEQRGAFTYEQLDDFIAPYWRTELRLGVVLMDRFRERLTAADVCPSQWYGAGAIATTLYRRNKMRVHLARTPRDRTDKDKDVKNALPEVVNSAARHAYAGGRFELFRLGHTDRMVYQYDIRSAYPNAIAGLPSLRNSEWEHQVSPTFDHQMFAMWRIEYDSWTDGMSEPGIAAPGPLFHRDWAGRVTFPHRVTGWYWTPEALLISQDPRATITEAWICHHNEKYPFEWVRDLYDERQRRKNAGDPSEKGLKLALNSLYGKMAQRLGWEPDNPLPRFHQLEWAGWVTSYTRMMLYTAMREAGPDLIATETDAVFSLRKLSLPVGLNLGEWDMTEHAWITYLQSGTYWSDQGAKYRGFDQDSLSHDDALRWLERCDVSTPLVGKTTRFIGAGRGLGTPLHRVWVTEGRDVLPGATGKRKHIREMCSYCQDSIPASESLHQLTCIARGGRSHPHPLPWLADLTPDISPWDEIKDVESWDVFTQ